MPITIIPSETLTFVGVPGYAPDSCVVETQPGAAQDPNTLLWAQTRTFGGTWTALTALAGELGGVKAISPRNGGFHTLVAVFSDLLTAGGGSAVVDPDEQVITSYAVQNQQDRLQVWDHPTVKAGLAGVTDLAKRAKIVAQLKLLAASVDSYAETTADDTTTLRLLTNTAARTVAAAPAGGAFAAALWDQVLEDLTRETPDTPWDTPVLTRVTLAPLLSSVRSSHALQNRILTNAGLFVRYPDVPAVMMEGLAALGGWFRAGGVDVVQVDNYTARITQQFFWKDSIESSFRYGAILTS